MIRPDKCPQCLGATIMVQYSYDNPEHYDGVSEIACVDSLNKSGKCNWRVGRWCGRKLYPGQIEPRYCTGGEHPLMLGHNEETKEDRLAEAMDA